MPRKVRNSNSRKSAEISVSTYSSDFDQNTKRDSKWWRDLSDASIRRSRDFRNRGNNEHGILSDSSFSYERRNSQLHLNLTQEKYPSLQSIEKERPKATTSIIEEVEKSSNNSQINSENVGRKTLFPRTGKHKFSEAFQLERGTTSIIEDAEKSANDSQSNSENVARKTLFLRAGKHKFSEAFQLEPAQRKQAQPAEDNLKKAGNSETSDKKDDLLKRKKRKTTKLFLEKPYTHRFSAAFYKPEEEKSREESELKSESGNEGTEQCSEIIVPATQENPNSQNTCVNENVEANETLTANKTNSEITKDGAQKNIFSSIHEETSDTLNEPPGQSEKPAESHESGVRDTDDSIVNKTGRIKLNVFEKKSLGRSKISEEFSKPKEFEAGKSIDETGEELAHDQRNFATESVERHFKFPRKSQQNDSTQMDLSENVATKQDLFRAKGKQSRHFSARFADSNISEISAQIDTNTNSFTTWKSLRQSKKNETSPVEMSESVQTKEDVLKSIANESKVVSEVFANTRNSNESYNNAEEIDMPVERSGDSENSVTENVRVKDSFAKENKQESRRVSGSFAKENKQESRRVSGSFAKENKKKSRRVSGSFTNSEIADSEANDEIIGTLSDTRRETAEFSARSSSEKSELCATTGQHEINEAPATNENVLQQKSQELKNKNRSLLENRNDAHGSSKTYNIKQMSGKNETLKNREEMLTQALKEFKQNSSQSIQKLVPGKKITDFFSKLNTNTLPKIPQGKVTKPKSVAKPIHRVFLVAGKKYRPKKLYSGARWCNKRFYEFLQDKIQNKYGETTILESENLMKYLVNYVTIIMKSKQYCPREIRDLKKELARNAIITTTHDFYLLIEKYLPLEFYERVIPRANVHPPIHLVAEDLFTPISF